MRYLILSVILSIGFLAKAVSPMNVVDAGDNGPIAGATVIAKSGMILGLTDENGQIEIGNNNYPIIIRGIGYEPLEITMHTDTARLMPTVYELGEFVVTPADRPIARVVCFAREYSSGITGQDTLQLYCEYMTESFLADGKVKGYKSYDAKPSERKIRRYARITKDGRDSIFRPSHNDDIKDLSWFDFMAFLPTERTEAPSSIKSGAETDSVPGKHGVKFVYRKKNRQFSKTADVLSDHKDRRWSPWIFKLLGLTVDIEVASWTLSFKANDSDIYDINNFSSGTYNIHMTGRGKWIKKAFDTKLPIEMDTYLELYPVKITHHTVEEYKELRDKFEPIPFRQPENLSSISPAVEQLIDKIDSKTTAK